MAVAAGVVAPSPSPGTDIAVDVRSLRVVRGGREVLHGIDARVRRGTLTALLGPSGGGKSTLMRSIVGVQRVAAGEVSVLGEPAGVRALRSRVAYTTQAPSVYLELTVTENLRYFARLLGLGEPAVAAALQAVDLVDHAATPAGRLSGGQLTRASLATALLGGPELLVLDEPTVGLDPVLRQHLWALFRHLAGTGATLLVSSHVLDEAEHCDELLLLRDGRVIAADTPQGLLQRTGTTRVEEAFLRLVAHGDEGRG